MYTNNPERVVNKASLTVNIITYLICFKELGPSQRIRHITSSKDSNIN